MTITADGLPLADRAGWPGIAVEGAFAAVPPVQAPGTLLLDDPAFGLLDTATLGTSDTWANLSGWVRSGSVTQPATRQEGPLWSAGAGTAGIILRNDDGRFDPDNAAGPYAAAGASALVPMTPVRASATWDGVTYPLFSGFADSWEPEDGSNYAGRYAQATLAATDGQKVLAGITLPAATPAGAGELAGARVSRVLNLAGWYTGTGRRRVAAGNSALNAYAGGDTAWNLMQAAADAEIGDLYLDGSGTLVFRERDAILTDARSATVQAVFGDMPGNAVPAVCSSPPLNDDPGFDAGIDGWSAGNGAVLAYSYDRQYGPQPGVMSVHGDGATAGPRALSALVTGLTAGHAYTVFMVTCTPSAWPVQAQADWKQSDGTYISSSVSAAVTVQDGWQVLAVTATAPALAAEATIFPSMTGTPGAGVMLYVGWAAIVAGDATSAAAELPYWQLQRTRDDATLANDVQATRVGGALQHVQDAASIARYLFPRSYARSDLILADDGTTLSWAQWVLYVAAGDADRFDELTLYPLRAPAALWPQALGRQRGDRIQVWRRPPAVADPVVKDCFIRGISHAWDWSAGTWATTWTLQDASKYGSFFTLDSSVLGRLDSNALTF